MNIVVVESPAKAKTINKYLGPGYEVLASFGHVRDLPAKDGSVDPDHDFRMVWEVDHKAEKRLNEIARAAIRTRCAPAFYRAIAGPDGDLPRQPGVLAALGFGERPLLRQGNFSLWRTLEDATRFAYARPAHGGVVRRARAEDWFAEELFARFVPYGSEGTWGGSDPLQL